MTASEFLQVLNELLYFVVAAAVIVEAIKRPRRTAIDTALFFAALGLILEVTGLSLQLGFAIPSVVVLILAALLLLLPYLQLRLLDDYVGVGPWVKRFALAGLILAVGATVVLPAPIPGIVTLGLVIYFVTLLGYCAVRFLRESRRAEALVAARLLAVAVGSGLLSLVLAIAVILPFVIRDSADITRLMTQLVILAAGVSYFVGFAPPAVVKRLWQESALRRFMQEINRLPDERGVNEVMRRLEVAAGTATAGSRALVALWDEDKAVLKFTMPDGTAYAIDTRTTLTLGGRVIQERQPILSEDPARDFPDGAEMYKRLGVRAILGAPIIVRGQVFGVLAVQSSHPSLFGRDDLEFLGLLADQIGVAVENTQLLAEVGRLTAEERRRGAEVRSRLATIVEASPDAIIGSTLDGLVTDWNPAAERIYGYTAAEAVGKNLVVVPTDRAGEVGDLATRIRAGQSIEQFETERIRKDGTRFDVSLGFAPLRDADGTIQGIATFARDITERVAAERREEDLEARLRQSERLESVGLLAGGIAHDFNNLLAVVLNYATFIEDKLPDNDPELKDDLAQIRRAAERGAVFTRQLLTFAHQRPVTITDLQLNEIIPGLRQMLRRSIPESIAIELRLAPDLWTVRADAGQLEQLLLNLVVNAGDAMPDGGTLLIETANTDIDEASASQLTDLVPGPYVRLTVTDTGHGMTKDIIDHAFEPFFTTKPTGKGTGLGLATVYGITKQAGGRVSIYSEVGQGTSVRALLPAQTLAAAAVAPVVVEPAASEGLPTNLTILLVEDEAAVRAVAGRILRAAGYRLIEASSPAAAIELATAETRIDLLVTDMVMPGMSGRDLSRDLRRIRPDLRVVYMSGYSEELVMRDSKLDGPLLQKPFNRESLLMIVRLAIAAEVRTRGSPVPIA